MVAFRDAIVFVLLGAGASPAAAQLVTGRLVDRTTGQPLDGAFVTLLDSAGTERGGMLTNPQGRYFLKAPAPGRYTIRAERIGYATYRSEPLDLAAGETRVFNMSVSTRAIPLDTIKVSGRQRCTVGPGGARTAEVWEEARKALRVVAWTTQQRAVQYRIVDFQRELDPGTLQVLSEKRVNHAGYWEGSPYRSHSPEDLAAHGYIRAEAGNHWLYSAPDAQVLLSDTFLDGHCFELQQQDSLPNLIGLAFRPVKGRSQPDIQGVLWLDRQSAELRYLEFVYTKLPFPVTSPFIGGRIDFERVLGGPWIVSSWYIRMPEVGVQHEVLGAIGLDQQAYRIVRIHEVGGEVVNVGDERSSTPPAAQHGGSVAGAVYDSSGIVPMADIQVSVVGTGRSVRTAFDGRFKMDGLPDGQYGLRVTPRTWDFPWSPPDAGMASVRQGDTAFVRLQLPNTAGLVRTLCSRALPDTLPGIVAGRLTDAAGQPLVGDTVIASWSRYALGPGRSDIQATWQATAAVTDDDGWYRACGVPLGIPIRVTAVPAHASIVQAADRLWSPDLPLPSSAREVHLDTSRILKLDLTAPTRP